MAFNKTIFNFQFNQKTLFHYLMELVPKINNPLNVNYLCLLQLLNHKLLETKLYLQIRHLHNLLLITFKFKRYRCLLL